MTDTNLPDELISCIAQYLTTPQLGLFRQVCKEFNRVGCSQYFLWPFYKRLYNLDNTLSPSLSHDSNQSMRQFQYAYEKIKKRQNEEIAYFNKLHFIYGRSKEAKESSTIGAVTLEKLEKRDFLINRINVNNILTAINQQAGNLSLTLDGNLTRFIIKEDLADNFQSFDKIIFKGNLLIEKVNLNNHPNLKSLTFMPCSILKTNTLKEIHLLGCSKDLKLRFDKLGQANLVHHYSNLARGQLLTGACFASIMGYNNSVYLFAVVACFNEIIRFRFQYKSFAVPMEIHINEATDYVTKKLVKASRLRYLNHKLSIVTSEDEKNQVIEDLGENFTVWQCLKYRGMREASIKLADNTSVAASALSTHFCFAMDVSVKLVEDALPVVSNVYNNLCFAFDNKINQLSERFSSLSLNDRSNTNLKLN